jgi:hypothetical protein
MKVPVKTECGVCRRPISTEVEIDGRFLQPTMTGSLLTSIAGSRWMINVLAVCDTC